MHIAEDFVDTGDRVLVMVTFRGHGRGSGMEAELPEFHIWTVRGGAIVRFSGSIGETMPLPRLAPTDEYGGWGAGLHMGRRPGLAAP